MPYCKSLNDISMQDVALFGGKNASLGQMLGNLSTQGILIPHGFAISTNAFKEFITQNNTDKKIRSLLKSVDQKKSSIILQKTSKKIRAMIESLSLAPALEQEIAEHYKALSQQYHVKQCIVAVRSSASAEDLPGASFAGQHESFLGVHGLTEVFTAIKKCMSSLFTQRAIIYRAEKGFDSLAVLMSVGVQKMIQASEACSGVSFSIDTETGFDQVIMIESVYGLGESIVQGIATPDLFIVAKQLLEKNVADPIIKKLCGKKESVICLKNGKITQKKALKSAAYSYTLNDQEIVSLAHMVLRIERHYSEKNKSYTPMDVEWAKDSQDGKIYIIQARPETVIQGKAATIYETYTLNTKKQPVLTGESIGHSITSGTIVHIDNIKKIPKNIPKECIIVASMTTPDLIVAIPNIQGIITERGGRTCHAAIISREMKIPAIVGVSGALKTLKTGDIVTIDCSQGGQGFVYEGKIPYEKKQFTVPKKTESKISIMATIASPNNVFSIAQLPVAGIGLTRIEFIIAEMIGIHPLAALFPDKVDTQTRKKITTKHGPLYNDAKSFFLDTLCQSLAQIAASLYPRPVIIRFSDFKTNEYRDLLGGIFFEPEESNPMLGFRGAARYIDTEYHHAFLMEIEVITYLVNNMGLSNIILLVPFVRTVDEGKKVTAMIKKEKQLQKIPIYIMIEIPANYQDLEQHANHFDGFSIGSNDLFQLFFGIDRDNARNISKTDERNETFLALLQQIIKKAQQLKKPIGICGQAPSDFPKIADFLINASINSISLNPDSVLPFLGRDVQKFAKSQ